jgi:hypothetical protein
MYAAVDLYLIANQLVAIFCFLEKTPYRPQAAWQG